MLVLINYIAHHKITTSLQTDKADWEKKVLKKFKMKDNIDTIPTIFKKMVRFQNMIGPLAEKSNHWLRNRGM